MCWYGWSDAREGGRVARNVVSDVSRAVGAVGAEGVYDQIVTFSFCSAVNKGTVCSAFHNFS